MGKKINTSGTSSNPEDNIELSLSEQLILWRRRKHWNQKRAAKFYNIPYVTYNFAESGKIEDFKYKEVELGALKNHEICFILRRRAGKTQEEIAHEIGCGVYWLRLQELGRVPYPKLERHWGLKNKN